MKKPLYELTLAEAERLIKCKDDNGEHMCRKCLLGYKLDGVGCCSKNAFYGRFFRYLYEQGLLSESDNGWEVELK